MGGSRRLRAGGGGPAPWGRGFSGTGGAFAQVGGAAATSGPALRLSQLRQVQVCATLGVARSLCSCACQPLSLSHTRTMARSPLPLFLLGSLLVLPSVLLKGVGMPGGVSPISVTDEGVQKASAFAVEQYNERSQDNANYFKQGSILEAQSQVVAGAKYYITVKIVKTACQKSSGRMSFSQIQQCALPPSDERKKLICDFQVWVRLWLNEMELTSMRCS